MCATRANATTRAVRKVQTFRCLAHHCPLNFRSASKRAVKLFAHATNFTPEHHSPSVCVCVLESLNCLQVVVKRFCSRAVVRTPTLTKTFHLPVPVGRSVRSKSTSLPRRHSRSLCWPPLQKKSVQTYTHTRDGCRQEGLHLPYPRKELCKRRRSYEESKACGTNNTSVRWFSTLC